MNKRGPEYTRRKYIVGSEMADREVAELAKKYSTPKTEEYFRQMLTSVVKLHFDKTDTESLRLINISLKELRHAFRIFEKYKNVKKVAMFGSARVKEGSKEYDIAEDFARKICKHGYMVITGGGGGVMEAGNKGATNKSFAVNIQLPCEQYPNPYIRGSDNLMSFHYFFTRKLIFVKESDATVFFPGGFGTNDEAFEILTLAQTGKDYPRPIVFVNGPHTSYWRSWLHFLKKELLRRKFLLPHDFNLFTVVNTVDEAVEEVANFFRNYHSIRHVGEKLVMRLNRPLSDANISRLNRKYSDILDKGEICPTGPLPEEVRDKDHTNLPRLVMNFNKHNLGRLFEMIREINTY